MLFIYLLGLSSVTDTAQRLPFSRYGFHLNKHLDNVLFEVRFAAVSCSFDKEDSTAAVVAVVVVVGAVIVVAVVVVVVAADDAGGGCTLEASRKHHH